MLGGGQGQALQAKVEAGKGLFVVGSWSRTISWLAGWADLAAGGQESVMLLCLCQSTKTMLTQLNPPFHSGRPQPLPKTLPLPPCLPSACTCPCLLQHEWPSWSDPCAYMNKLGHASKDHPTFPHTSHTCRGKSPGSECSDSRSKPCSLGSRVSVTTTASRQMAPWTCTGWYRRRTQRPD